MALTLKEVQNRCNRNWPNEYEQMQLEYCKDGRKVPQQADFQFYSEMLEMQRNSEQDAELCEARQQMVWGFASLIIWPWHTFAFSTVLTTREEYTTVQGTENLYTDSSNDTSVSLTLTNLKEAQEEGSFYFRFSLCVMVFVLVWQTMAAYKSDHVGFWWALAMNFIIDTLLLISYM